MGKGGAPIRRGRCIQCGHFLCFVGRSNVMRLNIVAVFLIRFVDRRNITFFSSGHNGIITY